MIGGSLIDETMSVERHKISNSDYNEFIKANRNDAYTEEMGNFFLNQ